MKSFRFLLCLCGTLVSACYFSPLYNNNTTKGVCVTPISEQSGYQIQRLLKQSFPDTSDCQYTLKVTSPQIQLSDQSISDKDFITMQQVQARTSYQLLNAKKEVVLTNTLSTTGSSAVISNPYATVTATENTASNLETALAEQIALHVTAFLNRDTK